MEVVQLAGNEGVATIKAAAAMRAGGVILYPTDTLYGLGADAFSDTAVDGVYMIKGRDAGKPMHCICADLEMAAEYAEINDLAKKLAEKFLPGPLTIVMKKKAGVDGGLPGQGIARKMETIGVRVPNNSFCLETARALGKPFTATSANLASLETGLSVKKILEQLGANAHMIDLVVDAGELPMRPPSTVVSVVNDTLEFLRIGAIARSEIEALLA